MFLPGEGGSTKLGSWDPKILNTAPNSGTIYDNFLNEFEETNKKGRKKKVRTGENETSLRKEKFQRAFFVCSKM